jgi:hypothetical protein
MVQTKAPDTVLALLAFARLRALMTAYDKPVALPVLLPTPVSLVSVADPLIYKHAHAPLALIFAFSRPSIHPSSVTGNARK